MSASPPGGRGAVVGRLGDVHGDEGQRAPAASAAASIQRRRRSAHSDGGEHDSPITGEEPRSVSTFRRRRQRLEAQPVGDVGRERSIRGTPCSSDHAPSRKKLKPPTAAIAISVVSSSPRLPGVSRWRPKRAVASSPPAAGRPSQRQAGAAALASGRTNAAVPALVQPRADLLAQLGVAPQPDEEVQGEPDRHDRAEREQAARDVLA